jgi:hypothetical protein
MARSQVLLIFRSVLLAGFALVLAVPAWGHVALDNPNGDEVLGVGSVFTITWHVVIAHDLQNWDLWYSTDSGTNWIPIAMDLPTGNPDAVSIHAYDWTVPDTPSDQARVRVRMDNSGTDYYDESKADFTIASGACLLKVIYGEYSDEMERMRYFRDNVLSQSQAGQEIIRLYYEWSPTIVSAMEEDEAFEAEVREVIDGALGMMGE